MERRDRRYAHEINDYLRLHPELTDLARVMANDPKPGPGLQPRGDGTWSLLLPAVQRNVTLLGRSSKLASVFGAIQFSRDRGANLNLYTTLYNNLPGNYLVGLDVPPVPPDRLGNADLTTIQNAIDSIGIDWRNIIGQVAQNAPLQLYGCDGELGASLHNDNYGDRSGNRDYCSPSNLGIYANFDFPNKTYNTCIKDQGQRGVCHTFAVTSATELQISLKHNLKVNLSEQDLMEHYRLLWQPGFQHESGDGFELASDVTANNYFQPYEDHWDYNPAPNVKIVRGTFVHVCDNYVANEPCSDSAPEAPEFCGLTLQKLIYCGFAEAGIAGGPYQLSGVSRFWNPANAELSTEMLVLSLAFNNSVVIAFNVTPGFQGAPSGFVPYTQADLTAPGVGQHVVHVIGFIGNTELQQKLPNAPAAAGPGYFIIKNSWDTCVGDGGYYYMPWNYLKSQAVDAFSITGVN